MDDRDLINRRLNVIFGILVISLCVLIALLLAGETAAISILAAAVVGCFQALIVIIVLL